MVICTTPLVDFMANSLMDALAFDQKVSSSCWLRYSQPFYNIDAY